MQNTLTQSPFSTTKSPYDRGGADSYYNRGISPHYLLDGQRVEELTDEQRRDYLRGFADNEDRGDHKVWD